MPYDARRKGERHMSNGPYRGFGGFTWGDFFKVTFWVHATVWFGGILVFGVAFLAASAIPTRTDGLTGLAAFAGMICIPGGALGAILSAIGLQLTRLVEADRDRNPPGPTCPTCNARIGVNAPTCGHCGAAVKWGNVQRPPAPGQPFRG